MTDIAIITLYDDELETLTLCDLDGLAQDKAENRMGVSRGTIQRLLHVVREKAAMVLSEFKAIVFEKTI